MSRDGPSIVIAGQAVSSLSNLATSLAILSVLSLGDYGVWGIIYGVLAITTNGLRSGVYESYLQRSSPTDLPPLGAPLAVASMTMLAGIVCIFASSYELGALMISFSALPVQDCLRYHSLILDNGRSALQSDSIWLAVSAAALLAIAAGNQDVAITLVLAVPFTSLAAILAIQSSAAPKRTWLRVGSFEAQFAAEGQLAAIAGAIALASLAVLQSPETVGSLRVLVLMFQPMFSLQLALRVLYLRSTTDKRAQAVIHIGLAWVGIYSLAAVGLWLVLRTNDVAIVQALSRSVFGFGLVAESLRAGAQLQSDIGRRLGESRRLISSRAASSIALVVLTVVLSPALALLGAVIARLLSQLTALLVFASPFRSAEVKAATDR